MVEFILHPDPLGIRASGYLIRIQSVIYVSAGVGWEEVGLLEINPALLSKRNLNDAIFLFQ